MFCDLCLRDLCYASGMPSTENNSCFNLFSQLYRQALAELIKAERKDLDQQISNWLLIGCKFPLDYITQTQRQEETTL